MIALRQNTLWIALVAALVLCPPAAQAQDPLERAKALYASAQFTDALAVLKKVRPTTRADTVAAAKTRALCLIALGRAQEAEGAFETLVEADPAVRLTQEEVSPRVRALFGEVRRRLLPSLLKERFTAAKALYTSGKREEATMAFKELGALLDDTDVARANAAGVSDLRVLVEGFLALTAVPDEAPASASASETAPTAPRDEAPAVAPGAARETVTRDLILAYSQPMANGDAPDKPPERTDGAGSGTADATAKGDEEDAPASAPSTAARGTTPPAIVPPVVIRQKVPAPRGITLGRQPAKLTLEVLIDEQGRVERASLTEPLHPIYDALVLDAAEDWQYKPATRDGQPVKFLKTIEITVRP